MSEQAGTPTGYEVWADYAPTTDRSKTYTKPGRVFGGATFSTLGEAAAAYVGAIDAEVMSRRMAADLGHPHHDATFSVHEVRLVRTRIAQGDLFAATTAARRSWELPERPSRAMG